MENPLLMPSSNFASHAPFTNAIGNHQALGLDEALGGDAVTNLDQLRQRSRLLRHRHRLSMYADPPAQDQELSIEEFERFALDRLQVLKCLESASLRNRTEDQLRGALEDAQRKYLPMRAMMHGVSPTEVDQERRKDYLSHFILRLAYCRSEDLRNWFVRYETLLFKLRWDQLQKNERLLFMEQSGFNYSPIPAQEKDALLPLLRNASCGLFLQQQPQTQAAIAMLEKDLFYKVPFEKVPDLVGRREVYIEAGEAYIPQSCLISVVVAEFKSHLMQALEATAKALPRMDNDDRLKPLLNNMSKHYFGQEFQPKGVNNGKGQVVTHEEVDQLVRHFPPCMRHLHNQLRHDHHLKHQGRMQYGLFLKGLGLSMEEALLFWQRAFSGKVTEDQFQKNYAYNIRHNYGREGKRTDYTPYSCMRIITSHAPGSGDNHGCPFKHFSKDALQSLLVTCCSQGGASSVPSSQQQQEVVELARQGHYQVACTKFYEVTRGPLKTSATPDASNSTSTSANNQLQLQHNIMDTIQHPNQFVELSMNAEQEQRQTSVPSAASGVVDGSGSQ